LGNCIQGAFSSDTTISTPVAINKGGTGQTTAQAALDALAAASGSLVQGDIFIVDSSGNVVRLARGSDNQTLVMNGSNPNWETAAGGTATSYITAASTSSYSSNSEQFIGWESGGGERTSTEVNAQLTFNSAFQLNRISFCCEVNSKNADTSLQFRDDESTVGNSCTITASTTGLFSSSADTTNIGAGSNCCFSLDTSSSGSGNLNINGLMVEISA
tara:strand:+ start:58 stop:705 length:648 start_codon:yes stop_codon:yes gene_type:complete